MLGASANHGASVPLYFFDTDDGERQIRDESGVDLEHLADVRTTVRDLLFDIGHADLLNGTDRVFAAVVRDEHGVTVYRGSKVLRIDHTA